ncbi:MAG: thioredoxin domain-containing protein [Bacteroidota bacterium]|nr:thioredoxin domain-containing protein [Bacteroidota bacterium]
MRYLLIQPVFLICFFLSGCGQTQEKGKAGENNVTLDREYPYTNHLIHESSPYLLQHAHNPVNWYPWGEKALKKAKDENKMIIISIGYAACHWCHVMEKETYEDTAVARIMNKHFISIKVDREERPDVDQVYMTAAQLITGSGGWPLNALALPDGRPFYAGTYFPKNDWMKMLNYFVEMNRKNPGALVKQAEDITKGIQSVENLSFKAADKTFTMNDLDKQFNIMKAGIDFKKGGTKGAPKFPMPSNWEYLMQYYYLSQNVDALKAVTVTLDNMAYGGIYDHLGGGFARYSTDADWHVPHFEKMLYDNAQLVSLYAHAFQLTKNPLYKKVVYETLDFVSRELTSPEGGFYSSLDADSDGEEGKYYVWTKQEIETVLGNDAALFAEYYNITKAGNWEHGKNILFRNETHEAIAKKYNLSLPALKKKIEDAKEKLMKVRTNRIKPALDDKILTSWNALMLKGYAQAYRVFGDENFLAAAIKNANFLMKNAIGTNQELTRNYKSGKSSINGLLDDYAFTVSAFIELYQATFDKKWLIEANKITRYTLEHFSDKKSGMFFYTSNEHSNLISRKMEIADNVIPASNSEMGKNLFILGQYFYNDDYISKAKQMLVNVKDDIQKNVSFYSNWGLLEIAFVAPPYEVAIIGNQFNEMRQKMDENYLPNILLSGGRNEGSLPLLENKLVEGQTTIYVCRDKVCKRPVTEVSKALEQLKNK